MIVKYKSLNYLVLAGKNGVDILPSEKAAEIDLDTATSSVVVASCTHDRGTTTVTFVPRGPCGPAQFIVKDDPDHGIVEYWQEYLPEPIADAMDRVGTIVTRYGEIHEQDAETFMVVLKAAKARLTRIFKACVAALEQGAPVADVERAFAESI
jgi:hypothetical protein